MRKARIFIRHEFIDSLCVPIIPLAFRLAPLGSTKVKSINMSFTDGAEVVEEAAAADWERNASFSVDGAKALELRKALTPIFGAINRNILFNEKS